MTSEPQGRACRPKCNSENRAASWGAGLQRLLASANQRADEEKRSSALLRRQRDRLQVRDHLNVLLAIVSVCCQYQNAPHVSMLLMYRVPSLLPNAGSDRPFQHHSTFPLASRLLRIPCLGMLPWLRMPAVLSVRPQSVLNAPHTWT